MMRQIITSDGVHFALTSCRTGSSTWLGVVTEVVISELDLVPGFRLVIRGLRPWKDMLDGVIRSQDEGRVVLLVKPKLDCGQ